MLSPKPCSRMTGSPAPISSTWVRTPATRSTWLRSSPARGPSSQCTAAMDPQSMPGDRDVTGDFAATVQNARRGATLRLGGAAGGAAAPGGTPLPLRLDHADARRRRAGGGARIDARREVAQQAPRGVGRTAAGHDAEMAAAHLVILAVQEHVAPRLHHGRRGE